MRAALIAFVLLLSNPSEASWNLIWADEFETAGSVDATRWMHEVDFGPVNGEAQLYTNRLENARVENGQLVIEARKERMGEMNYTSARLITRPQASWRFGRFEARIKLPLGRGTWPAFWMMPATNIYGDLDWPDNGEIDILEHVGYNAGIVHSTIHTNVYNWMAGTNPMSGYALPDGGDGFHVYALEWTPWDLTVYVNDVKTFHFVNPALSWREWPFDQPFYIILNLAIGGNWGGQQGIDDDAFPQKMFVDYVRVFESAP